MTDACLSLGLQKTYFEQAALMLLLTAFIWSTYLSSRGWEVGSRMLQAGMGSQDLQWSDHRVIMHLETSTAAAKP